MKIVEARRIHFHAARDDEVGRIDIRLEAFKPWCAETWPARLSYELWLNAMEGFSHRMLAHIMSVSLWTGEFLHDVASYVSSGLESNVAKSGVAIRPKRGERFRSVELVIAIILEEHFIVEIVIEDDRVIMRAKINIAIFSAGKTADFLARAYFTQLFHEELPRSYMHGVILRQMFISERESDETVVGMELRFMRAAQSPLTRALETAADAAAARNFKRAALDERIKRIEGNQIASGGQVEFPAPVRF